MQPQKSNFSPVRRQSLRDTEESAASSVSVSGLGRFGPKTSRDTDEKDKLSVSRKENEIKKDVFRRVSC